MSHKIEEFVKADKKLNANVDFYSASTYHTLGIDVDLFTPDLRGLAHQRLGRARDRATRRQSPDPSARRVSGAGLSQSLRRRSTSDRTCIEQTLGWQYVCPLGAAIPSYAQR